MKRVLGLMLASMFGVFYIVPTAAAQQVSAETCTVSGQDIILEELPMCEETPEEHILKGEPSKETVAGTEAIFVERESAVLGVTTITDSSPAVLAATGVDSKIMLPVGALIISAAVISSKITVVRFKTVRNKILF